MVLARDKNGGSNLIRLSPGGDYVQRGAGPSDTMIAGTADGIYVLQRSAKGEWAVMHRALQGCFVSAVTACEDGTLFAGTHGVGMARSDDQGRTWRWINQGLAQFDVWAARVVKLNGRERIYAGTMPAHLFVSDDGESWRELTALRQAPSISQWFFPPPPHLGHVKEIVGHEGRRLMVGIEVGALLVSDDAGETFSELPVDPDPRDCDLHHIAVHPAMPDRIIISNGLAGMMTSEDRGRTWRRGPAPPGLDYPDPLVMHPDDPNVLFVAGAVGWPSHWYPINRSRTKIARSRDGAKNWERLLGGLPDGQRAIFSAMTLEAWDGGFAVYAGDTDGQIFESRDGGDRWHMIVEVGPMSKGDFYRGLAKNRPPMANIDDLKIPGPAAARIAKAEV
ncbi:MAG: hypothetical protein GEU91_09900 [Rhizobiales bacterium]|nr:hypothetical protein [Hyphomicrobiales bacterium]